MFNLFPLHSPILQSSTLHFVSAKHEDLPLVLEHLKEHAGCHGDKSADDNNIVYSTGVTVRQEVKQLIERTMDVRYKQYLNSFFLSVLLDLGNCSDS